jgi:hypothetical protein
MVRMYHAAQAAAAQAVEANISYKNVPAAHRAAEEIRRGLALGILRMDGKRIERIKAVRYLVAGTVVPGPDWTGTK